MNMTAAEHQELAAGKLNSANVIYAARLVGDPEWFATDQGQWTFGVLLERVPAPGVRLP